MKKIYRILIITSVLFLSINVTYSQVKLGPGVGMNININHGSDIKAAGGIGILATGQLEIPLNKTLELLLNVQFYDNRSGYFKQDSTRSATDQAGKIWQLNESLDYSTSIAYFSVEPILMIRTSKIFYFLGGLSFGYNVQKTYKVTTTESFPANYDGNGITLNPKNTVQRAFNNFKTRVAMKLGFGFDIPGSIFDISPQLYYDIGFTKVTSDLNWRIQSFQALVTFKFKLS